jgi:hypothetical protein
MQSGRRCPPPTFTPGREHAAQADASAVSGPPQQSPNAHSLLPMPQHCHQFPRQCTTPNTLQTPTSASRATQVKQAPLPPSQLRPVQAATRAERSELRCPPPSLPAAPSIFSLGHKRGLNPTQAKLRLRTTAAATAAVWAGPRHMCFLCGLGGTCKNNICFDTW